MPETDNCQIMKKYFPVLVFCLLSNLLIAQQISPALIGTNVWLPPWMGGSKWNELKDDLGDAGYQLIRIGGNGAQSASAYTNVRIANLVEEIYAQGAMPIVQVPYTHTAQQATDMITYINGTRGLDVRYWAIGNEPNHQPKVEVSVVAAYIRRIASALKAYDPDIKTLGPTPAWYDTAYLNPLFVTKGADDISGTDENGNYYIDVLTWNTYALTYGMGYNGTINSAVNLVTAQNNTRPEGKKMSWAILEFNGHYDNDIATDAQKCWSFNTGQMFAEMFDIGMKRGAFTLANWSIYEGGGNRSKGDLGLFDGLGSNYGSAVRGRSSYYHSLMLGRHMKGTYLTSVHNGPAPSGANSGITVSSMGDEGGFSVMIINRSNTLSYEYNIGLNNVFGATAALRIRVAAGIDKEVKGHIAAKTTQMLVLDGGGNMIRMYEYNETHANNYCGPFTIDYSDSLATEASIHFVSPANGSMHKTSHRLTVDVEVEHPSGIVSVDLYKDGTLVGTLNQAPFLWDDSNQLLADLAPGFYELTAVAHIEGGATVTKTINFGNTVSYAPEDPMPVPGKIEAEYFDSMYGIQTEPTTDEGGGLNIAYVDTGDWLDYIVDVKESGMYEAFFRVAGWTDNGRVSLRNTAGTLAWAGIPNQGALQYQNWVTVKGGTPFRLEAGIQTLRIYAEGHPFNLNYFEILPDATNTIEKGIEINDVHIYPMPSSDVLFVSGAEAYPNLDVYDLGGRLLKRYSNLQDSPYRINVSDVAPGMFFIHLFNEQESVIRKVIR